MALATGQITIVDLTDLPSIQGYLISNKPKIQFLNTGGAYNPTWSTESPLTLSAEIYAVGTAANLISDSRIKDIIWYKDGNRITASGGGITLVPHPTGNGKISSISITQNLLTPSSPTMLITAEVKYQHTNTVAETPIKLQIELGLSQQGATGQTGQTGGTGLSAIVPILSNESVALPASFDKVVTSYGPGATTIMVYEGTSLLTHDAVGTANGSWKVAAANGGITAGAITKSGTTIAAVAAPSAMTADTAKLTFTITGKRLDGTPFSIVRVQNFTKAIAGRAGDNVKTVDISGAQIFKLNEFGVSLPKDITLTATAQNVAGTNYTWTFGLDGAAPTTALNLTNFPGVSFTGNTVTITEDSSGWQGANSITLKVLIDGVFDTFTVSKVRDGSTARTINLSTTSNTMTFDLNNVAKPTTQNITLSADLINMSGAITFTATAYLATGAEKTAKISLTGTGNTRTLSAAQWLTAEAALPLGEVVRVVVKAEAGGLSDTVTIVKLRDAGVFSGYLTNESVLVPATKDGAVIGTLTSLTAGSFETFFGTQALTSGVEYLLDGTVVGGSASINKTTGAYSVSSFTNNATDTVTAKFKATHAGSGAILKKTLTVVKSKVGQTGNDAVVPLVWAPLGEVFKSIAGSNPTALTIQCDLFVGGAETAATEYKWYIQEGIANDGWELLGETNSYGITGAITKTITVPASAVKSLENFKCVATYKGKPYSGVVTLTDMTDPYQVTIIAEGGTTFINGEGASKVLTAKVFQLGEEIDTLGTAFDYSWKKFVGGAPIGGVIATTKKLTVNANEISAQATFTCDIDKKK